MGKDGVQNKIIGGIIGGIGIIASAAYFGAKNATKVIKKKDLPRKGTNSREMSQIEELVKKNKELQSLLRFNEVSKVDVEEKNNSGYQLLTRSEIETIRHTFQTFQNENGEIDGAKDLNNLHSKLGEPLTDEEAKEAFADISVKGIITFDKFLRYWYDSHQDYTSHENYKSRFKFAKSKLEEDLFTLDKIRTKQVGSLDSREYRVKFFHKGNDLTLKEISPWHDIPLRNQTNKEYFNFICEIPKWSRAKYEIATGEVFNPIKQDTKNGKLRFYKYGDMLFNYGALPQTWEDPNHIDEETKFCGDNDPIDVIEIGTRKLTTGEVVAVKVLGVLALIDDKETDWKIIAINISDPLAKILNDIDDVEEHLPGAIDAIKKYLRLYKVWSGKPENMFALNGEPKSRGYALKVIEHTHEFWKELKQKEV